MSTHEAGTEVRNAKCEGCGTMIPFAVVRGSGRILCSKCAGSSQQVLLGTLFNLHCSDDSKGSWDNIVRTCEDSENENK